MLQRVNVKLTFLYSMRMYNVTYFLYLMRKTLFRRRDYKVTFIRS